ncbi:TetR family transcriptional regulator [Simiduia sp. 21SJ11W-1]|uniref:TetR/AcrR family transcriptional regulator n=1 Tax=Simiduia sp. 21SJ11W-1 TaxID=2909669 RepID=UPI00209E7F7B|nr:TetR family transcriptional regulator [Simiduia sp. 21SJ11W-1]UTA48995.1 TetR family transcriptional regulator [Simiduia sp. 21SJ11W-1]
MAERSKKAGTRQHLMQTAINLYARHGLDGVSLRQIGAAAGAKNSAAMHYHFTDKLGLLDASVAYIRDQLAQVEVALAQPQPSNLELLVEAEVMVWAHMTVVPDWGQSAVKLVSRLLLEFDTDIRQILNHHLGSRAVRFRGHLQELFPSASAKQVAVRSLLALDSIVHGTAEVDVITAAPFPDIGPLSLEDTRPELIRYVVQGLRF